MDDLYFCPPCGMMTGRRIQARKETLNVRGVPIEVDADVAVCVACGQDVADMDLDDMTLERAYAIYRQRFNILSPIQIREIRERSGLSQRGFGRLLGWGDVTVHRYETGALPDMAHNALLEALQDEETLYRFIERRLDALSSLDQRKVRAMINQRRPEMAAASVRRGLELFVDTHSAAERGHRPFDLERVGQMIVYFVSHGRVTKTKLLKMLWYADFLCFKRSSVSLSGLAYVRLPFGPVPDQYDLLLFEVEQEGFMKSHVWQSASYAGTDYEQLVPFDASLFGPHEIAVLEAVQKRLANLNATETANLSHQEAAWRETPELRVIPYSTAQTLSFE